MLQISKKELFDKYGIDLEKGQYTVENVNGTYKINILRDDTSGCILVGTSHNNDTLLHSKVALQELINKFKMAIKKKEPLTIKVVNPEKPTKAKPKPKQPQVVVEDKPVELPKVETVDTVQVIKPEVIQTEVQTKPNTFKNFIQWILSCIFKN